MLLKRLKFLITNQSVKKYLAYSIGEILLITVGIVLALQVNNWNENRKQKQLEFKLLHELKENLKLDLEDIASNIRANTKIVNAHQIVLKQLDENIPYHDSLEIHYANLLRHTNFISHVSAYENLKSLGFTLISNASLRIMLSSLYSAKYKYIVDFEQNYADKFQLEQLYPNVIQRVRIVRFFREAYPFDPAALTRDTVFKEMVRTNEAFRAYILNYYIELEQEVGDFIVQIDQYLQKD